MSELVENLSAQIADYIQFEGLPPATRLPERYLAERFKVSRSPVREALRLLETRDIVRHIEGQGFVTTGTTTLLPEAVTDADIPDLYEQLADDHLAGIIPERMSQNALMRRYDATSAQMTKALLRAAQEGWVERLPGHGWAFLPVLTSLEAYEQSYRFRMLIEPAGILEPTFAANENQLLRCRAQQEHLLSMGPGEFSAATLFQAGVRVHEAIMECSGNAFLLDGLRRANQLRRLLAYQRLTPRWIANCKDHIEIIDLILADRRADAARYLREHLAQSLEGSRNTVKRIAHSIKERNNRSAT